MGTPSTRRRQEVTLPGGARVALIEKRYEPRAALGRHRHENPNLTWMIAGEAFEELDGGRLLHPAGHLLLKGPAVAHANRFGAAGGRALVIEFDREPALGDPRGGVLMPPASPAARIVRRVHAEVAEVDELSVVTLQGLLFQLVAPSSPLRVAARHPPPWLDRVRERLHDDPLATPRLGELARDAGVHPDHLARTFARHIGIQLGHYQRRLRLEWAARRLVESSSPLSEIALDAGFADQSHFGRWFKRAYRQSPARYRASRREPRGAARQIGSVLEPAAQDG